MNDPGGHFHTSHASVWKRTPCWPRPSDLLPYWVKELLGVWILFKTPQANGTGAARHGPQPDKGPFPLLPTGWRVPKEGTPGRGPGKRQGQSWPATALGRTTPQPLTSAGVYCSSLIWLRPSAIWRKPTLGGRKYWSRFGGEINYRK